MIDKIEIKNEIKRLGYLLERNKNKWETFFIPIKIHWITLQEKLEKVGKGGKCLEE